MVIAVYPGTFDPLTRGHEDLVRRAAGLFSKLVVGVADIPYKCPPAPLEFTFLLDDYLRERGIRERSEIVYLSPINRVFTIESVAQFVTPLLEERGIRYELFFNTESIDPQARTITSLEGTTLDYDTALLTKGFVFNNPNAKQTCGCGSSFGA